MREHSSIVPKVVPFPKTLSLKSFQVYPLDRIKSYSWCFIQSLASFMSLGPFQCSPLVRRSGLPIMLRGGIQKIEAKMTGVQRAAPKDARASCVGQVY